MRWQGRRQSTNVIDLRGRGGKVAAGGGIGIILIAIVFSLLGGDPRQVLQYADQGGAANPAGVQTDTTPAGNDDPMRQFVGVVLADTEDVWTRLFRQQLGETYQEPKLVLFSGQVQSACGFASAAVGPFYCGEDDNVYLDLSFFRELSQKFGAPGDFAQAYVIAHEVGHHVQDLMGTLDRVHAQRQRMSKQQANELSVRLELQADFYAGVFAHHADRTKNILDREDIEEALRAASAIGDDRLQQQGQGYVVPDSFTHGTSEQRVRWFRRGWESGDLSQGDTFRARNL